MVREEGLIKALGRGGVSGPAGLPSLEADEEGDRHPPRALLMAGLKRVDKILKEG